MTYLINYSIPPFLKYHLVKQTFNDTILIYRKFFTKGTEVPQLLSTKPELQEIVTTLYLVLSQHPLIKFTLTAFIQLGQFQEGKLLGTREHVIPSRSKKCTFIISEIVRLVNESCAAIVSRSEDLKTQGSNWVFLSFTSLDIRITKLRPYTRS